MILTTDKCNIRFSDLIQLHELYYSTILDCRGKTCSIFAKPVSEKEIAIFGDYEILVFYRNLFANGEKNYGAITVRKNICEIVPFEVEKNTEIKSVLLLQPCCNFKQKNHKNSNSYWEIEVQGEIKINNEMSENEMSETDANSDNAAPLKEQAVDFDSHESDVKPFDSQEWQFEESDDISIEQLMDMDLESLKNMKK